MLALDLHVVICTLDVKLLRREVLHIQVDCELVPVGPHLEKNQRKLWNKGIQAVHISVDVEAPGAKQKLELCGTHESW